MLDVTQAAMDKLAEYFEKQPEKSPVRVFLNPGG